MERQTSQKSGRILGFLEVFEIFAVSVVSVVSVDDLVAAAFGGVWDAATVLSGAAQRKIYGNSLDKPKNPVLFSKWNLCVPQGYKFSCF